MPNPTDYYPANLRDIPSVTRRYTADYGGDSGVKVWRLPLNIKVCAIVNKTNQPINFYPTFWTGSAYLGADDTLHTDDTSSRIETVGAGETFPLAQHEGLNTLITSAGSAATGELWFRCGQGQANGYPEAGDVEARALEAVS